ncbi:hypothetical protein ASE74_23250 [Pedobacter sp. Leaf216]|nr:hypothetical protein ASE74_23250 [Pedobacter sp. Leaf216]
MLESALRHLRPAIWHSRFSQEKPWKSLHFHSLHTNQGRIKQVRMEKWGESLDTAAIKISIGFYKKGCKP